MPIDDYDPLTLWKDDIEKLHGVFTEHCESVEIQFKHWRFNNFKQFADHVGQIDIFEVRLIAKKPNAALRLSASATTITTDSDPISWEIAGRTRSILTKRLRGPSLLYNIQAPLLYLYPGILMTLDGRSSIQQLGYLSLGTSLIWYGYLSWSRMERRTIIHMRYEHENMNSVRRHIPTILVGAVIAIISAVAQALLRK